MFHPLMKSLKDVGLDDLLKQTNDLHSKYNQSLRSGNSQMAHQLRLVLNYYQEEYQKRMTEQAEKTKESKYLKDKVQIKK